MDAELLDDALAAALAYPEISGGLQRLAGDEDPAPLRDDLSHAVRTQTQEVESAARDELARLAAVEAELERALADPIALAIAGDRAKAAQHARLRTLADAHLNVRSPWRAMRALLVRAPGGEESET